MINSMPHLENKSVSVSVSASKQLKT
jgi:hypothetical protein